LRVPGGVVDFNSVRVLVADDDESIRETLLEALIAMGFDNVRLAEDGERALEALGGEATDLVLLDLVMPKIRGEEVVDVALGRYPDLVIIVITGFATLDKAVSLMQKGIYDLVRKPFSPYTLARKIESALLKHEARMEGNGEEKDFGDFELLDEVSRGGMGVIWKAREKESGDVVALKVLLAGKKATDEQVLRFHREADTISKLEHPAIVSIRRVGAHKGAHYIAMDFIDGKPLDEWIEYNDPPLHAVLDVLRETAEALHFAHERHFLHRDLKPSNILVDKKRKPRIIDFGLAKSLRDDLRITERRHLHGTVGFMAPERFSDRGEGVDVRSDIFSLGVILYEILTGTFPYRMLKELEFLPDFGKPPAPPIAFRPELSESLSDSALKAIALDPVDRFQTALEFSKALEIST